MSSCTPVIRPHDLHSRIPSPPGITTMTRPHTDTDASRMMWATIPPLRCALVCAMLTAPQLVRGVCCAAHVSVGAAPCQALLLKPLRSRDQTKHGTEFGCAALCEPVPGRMRD